MKNQILFQNIQKERSEKLSTYEEWGGYEALRRAIAEMTPDEVLEEVKESGLRGRGGAGFPTGLKWSFMPRSADGPKYLCCNADEGEPGAFKDRELIEKDPHMLVEGIVIAGYAMKVERAFIYIRGEYGRGIEMLTQALEEARSAGYWGEGVLGSKYALEIDLYIGAGGYIVGEETALMNSIEGQRGEPRIRPPFPAQHGVFGRPTTVNNVETIASVPHIIMNGASWFRSFGTEKSPGTKIFSVSGSVNDPQNVELELGTPLREIIDEHAGGVQNGRSAKIVFPGGSSTPALSNGELDVPMDYESLQKVGSLLGTGSIIVVDNSHCIVKVAARVAAFYAHETCGQCTPCREGTPWVARILSRIEEGRGRREDLDLLLHLCQNMTGTTICAFAPGAANPITSCLKKFRAEFEEHIHLGRCPTAVSTE